VAAAVSASSVVAPPLVVAVIAHTRMKVEGPSPVVGEELAILEETEGWRVTSGTGFQ
jgi:hypothetical protein